MSLLRRFEENPAWSNFFNDIFNRDWMDWTNRNFSDTNTTLPSVNIKEDENGYEVEVAAPGLDKNDFSIELDNQVLNISSEKKVTDEIKEGQQFTRREFSYQSFCRSFTLPNTVDPEKISAKYTNGILRIEIPKREEAKKKPAKMITIK
jgi:HSP20 family protein